MAGGGGRVLIENIAPALCNVVLSVDSLLVAWVDGQQTHTGQPSYDLLASVQSINPATGVANWTTYQQSAGFNTPMLLTEGKLYISNTGGSPYLIT
jgi:hypothetical protein